MNIDESRYYVGQLREICPIYSLREVVEWIRFRTLCSFDDCVCDPFSSLADNNPYVDINKHSQNAGDDIDYQRVFESENEIRSKSRDIEKTDLFSKLVKKELVAYGQYAGHIKSPFYLKDWKDQSVWVNIETPELEWYHVTKRRNYGINNPERGITQIPSDFWTLEGINWLENLAYSHEFYYKNIFLITEELFEVYPLTESFECINVKVFKAGNLLYDLKSNDIKTSKKGRKSYNWPEFHAEVARYIVKNGSLPKMTALEHYLSAWSKEKWGLAEGLSHGSMYEQLKPYYEHEELKTFVKK
jgi:hypothetical protein